MATDTARLHAVFDLAMRVGEGLLTNGAAASEVTATVLRITSSSGLRNVSVQVTFDELTISYLDDDSAAPFTRVRSAGTRVQDFDRLAKFEDVTHDYISGDLDLDRARREAVAITLRKPLYRLGLVVSGFGVLGGAAALSLGGGLLVVLTATLAAAFGVWAGEVLGRRQIPLFYAQAFSGLVAVVAAVLVSLVEPAVNSSIVVVACIIVQLAGLTSIGAMQDAVTGWYVTAAGRILETLMLTLGLVVGVRGGLLVSELVGVDIAVSAAMPVSLLGVAVLVVSGAAMGLGFGVGTQVPQRLLLWIALVAGTSAVISYLLTGAGLNRVHAVAIASFIGCLAAAILGDRLRAPALIFVMGAVIPLVPGGRIFRGLLGLGDDVASGAFELIGAGEVAIAIAAGAVLGQLVGSRIMRLTSRSAIAYTPVISSPFTTLRRRRMTLGPGRGPGWSRRRRRDPAVSEPSTLTGEMVALTPTMIGEDDPTDDDPTDREER